MPTSTANDQMQLVPYIFFYGHCDEALEFYARVLGGTYEVAMRHSAFPPNDRVAPEFREKVMHAQFNAPGISFMASDGGQPKQLNPNEGNLALSLTIPSANDGERIFKQLAEGGNILVPLEEASWGGRFGIIQDRFATEWMITLP